MWFESLDPSRIPGVDRGRILLYLLDKLGRTGIQRADLLPATKDETF